MEKEGNIINLENYNLKDNLQMIKEMEKEKNIIQVVGIYYLLENIKMGKEMEKEQNMIMIRILFLKENI